MLLKWKDRVLMPFSPIQFLFELDLNRPPAAAAQKSEYRATTKTTTESNVGTKVQADACGTFNRLLEVALHEYAQRVNAVTAKRRNFEEAVLSIQCYRGMLQVPGFQTNTR